MNAIKLLPFPFKIGSFAVVLTVVLLLMSLGFVSGALEAQPKEAPGKAAESKNMRLVGHADLQGRAAYKGHVQEQDGRYIAYVGHGSDVSGGDHLNPLTGEVEVSGTSIVDVTDPRNPQYLAHIPATFGVAGAGAGLQTCAGDDLPDGTPGSFYLARTQRDSGAVPPQHELWDVTDPSNPEFMSVLQDNLDSIHKNWWECSTGIAYLASGVPGWETRGMSIFDLSDPENPEFIRNFGLPGSQPGEDPAGRRMTALHEPLYVDGRVYMAYGTSSDGILQILDNDKLLEGDPDDPYDPLVPTDEQLLYPEIGRLDSPSFWGVHTAFPLLGMELPQYEKWNDGTPRDFVVSVSESTSNECDQPMHDKAFFVDITDPENPYSVSNFQVPESEGNFCERGDRFGAHSTNWNFTDVYYNRIVWISYFNAGVRGVDVRDPFNPVQVAHYIPAVTENTVEVNGKLTASTNNVDVDDRGYVYTFDKLNTGMHILVPTGQAKKIANMP